MTVLVQNIISKDNAIPNKNNNWERLSNAAATLELVYNMYEQSWGKKLFESELTKKKTATNCSLTNG